MKFKDFMVPESKFYTWLKKFPKTAVFDLTLKRRVTLENKVAVVVSGTITWQLPKSRFVAVRFFAPGLTMVEVYDRESKGDVAAWKENQALYPCQLVAHAAKLSQLKY